MAYGKELILDLYGCDVFTFNRKSIKDWLDGLCKLINMVQEDLHFWDFEGVPQNEIPTEVHLVGTSAVQFIATSDIVIHTLDLVGECYINIFSCKDYNCYEAKNFTKKWFRANEITENVIFRGEFSQVKTNISEDDCLECLFHSKCSGGSYIRQACSKFKKETKT